MHQIWTRVVEAPRVVVDYAANAFLTEIPWALAALGIGLAGVVVAYVFIIIAERWTKARSDLRRPPGEEQETTRNSKNSIIRVIAMTLAILALVFGFWIAANTAGFNFWTVMLGYGILSLVGTYAFGTTLQNAGAFFLISMTNKIGEEYVIEVAGVSGRIIAIHILWVELEAIGDIEKGIKKGEEIQVPTHMLLNSIVRRKFHAERKRVPVRRKYG